MYPNFLVLILSLGILITATALAETPDEAEVTTIAVDPLM